MTVIGYEWRNSCGTVTKSASFTVLDPGAVVRRPPHACDEDTVARAEYAAAKKTLPEDKRVCLREGAVVECEECGRRWTRVRDTYGLVRWVAERKRTWKKRISGC